MKKNIRKLLSLIMTTGFVASSISACTITENYDDTKTQLFIQPYDGGYGVEWLEKLKTRFESEYSTYELNGKKGVEIIILQPQQFLGTTLDNEMATLKGEVFFVEQGNNYYALCNNNKLLDITDILTQPLTEYGENISIVDKMPVALKGYYGRKQMDGSVKYFGVPYATAFTGLIYDEDLFYSEGLFYNREYDEDETLVRNDRFISKTTKTNGEYATLVIEGEKSYYKTNTGEYLGMGPDGVYGTMDDGQPKTYDDMFVLCDYMITESDNISPFMHVGSDPTYYLQWLFEQLVVNYEGEEQFMNFFNATGTAKNLIKVNDSGEIENLDDLELSDANYEEIYKTAGIYYAAKFMEIMYSNSAYVNSDSYKLTTDQITAEENLIYSIKDNKKIAFLIDGIWWENEASDTMEQMNKMFGKNDEYARKNRNFRILSLPKVNKDKIGESTCYVDTHYTLSCIRSDIGDKAEIAKKFLQFCYTEESNCEFTVTTGTSRPMNYVLDENELGQMSSFAQQIYKIQSGEEAKLVYPLSQRLNESVKAVNATLGAMTAATINNTFYLSLKDMFYGQKFSAKQVFDGVYNYNKQKFLS